jgi:hypothetical protein
LMRGKTFLKVFAKVASCGITSSAKLESTVPLVWLPFLEDVHCVQYSACAMHLMHLVSAGPRSATHLLQAYHSPSVHFVTSTMQMVKRPPPPS